MQNTLLFCSRISPHIPIFIHSKEKADLTANKTKQLKVVVDTSQPISIQPKNQTDLDVLIKLDLIDSEDMEEVSEFLDKLLAQEKYEGRRELNVKYVVE